MMADNQQIARREFLRLTAVGSLAFVPGFGLTPGLDDGRPNDNLHCICIFNTGGMSHLDLWDPKPNAPSEIRGEFAPIETSVPGIYFSELLPKTARVADKLAIVRCMSHREFDRALARHETIRNVPMPRESVVEFPMRHAPD